MKDLIRYIMLVRLCGFLRYAPVLAVRAVTFVIALVEYVYHKRARRVISDGLKRDLRLGPWALRKAVLGSFYQHLLNDFEVVRFPTINQAFTDRHVRISGPGWEFLQKNPNTAAVLCTFHFGPNQIVIPVLPTLGFPFTQMAIPPTHWDTLIKGNDWTRAVNRILTDSLEATPTPFIYVSEGIASLRKIREVLHSGQRLCVACDGRVGKWIEHPFFDSVTDINPGGIKIAIRNNAPLVPFFVRRTWSGYSVEMHEPIHLTADAEDQTVHTLVLKLEEYVKAYPEQYGWLYYTKAVGG